MDAIPLKLARTVAKTSQQVLATMAGVPRWKIADFERGKKALQEEDERRIFNALLPLLGTASAAALFPEFFTSSKPRPESADPEPAGTRTSNEP